MSKRIPSPTGVHITTTRTELPTTATGLPTPPLDPNRAAAAAAGSAACSNGRKWVPRNPASSSARSCFIHVRSSAGHVAGGKEEQQESARHAHLISVLFPSRCLTICNSTRTYTKATGPSPRRPNASKAFATFITRPSTSSRTVRIDNPVDLFPWESLAGSQPNKLFIFSFFFFFIGRAARSVHHALLVIPDPLGQNKRPDPTLHSRGRRTVPMGGLGHLSHFYEPLPRLQVGLICSSSVRLFPTFFFIFYLILGFTVVSFSWTCSAFGLRRVSVNLTDFFFPAKS